MARIAATGTVVNNANGNHLGQSVAPGGESGHVYVSFDNATVTSFAQLRNLIQAALVPLQGQLKP